MSETKQDKRHYLRMIAGNGPSCTYGIGFVATATGLDVRELIRRHGQAVSAATFRRLLTSRPAPASRRRAGWWLGA